MPFGKQHKCPCPIDLAVFQKLIDRTYPEVFAVQWFVWCQSKDIHGVTVPDTIRAMLTVRTAPHEYSTIK
jgi:hypothetical protein